MPNTWTKAGVRGNLHPIMMKAQGRLERLYYGKGLDFYITSIGEGNHGPGSFHLFADWSLAEDFKRQGVSIAEIRDVLGEGFDVVEYHDERDIFHMEFDKWKK